MNKCVIYTRNNLKVPISEQFRVCRKFAHQQGFKIAYHIDDVNGDRFHEAVNFVIGNKNITSLIIYNKVAAFDDMDEFLFFCIYMVKLNKQLLSAM